VWVPPHSIPKTTGAAFDVLMPRHHFGATRDLQSRRVSGRPPAAMGLMAETGFIELAVG
jgi:hypothetical protein